MSVIAATSPSGHPEGTRTALAAQVKRRDRSVETLRGLAIVLVVMGHVVLEMGSRGHVAAGHMLAYLTESMSYLRMPLFTVISGYVYAMRPVRAGGEKRFVLGKLRRVMLPFLTVGVLEVIYRDYRHDGHAFNAVGQAIFDVFLLDGSHLWYLKALFLIFLLTVVLDAAGAIDKVAPWLVVLGLTAVCSIAMAGDERYMSRFMAVGNGLYIMPYFFFGLGIRRFTEVFARRDVLLVGATVFIVGTALHQFWLMPIQVTMPGTLGASAQGNAMYLEKIVITAVGLSGTMLLFRFRRNVPGLSTLGSHAYVIYLLHGVCYYSVYAVAKRKLAIDDEYALFFLMMAAGLLLPILIKLAVLPFKPARRMLLGLS